MNVHSLKTISFVVAFGTSLVSASAYALTVKAVFEGRVSNTFGFVQEQTGMSVKFTALYDTSPKPGQIRGDDLNSKIVGGSFSTVAGSIDSLPAYALRQELPALSQDFTFVPWEGHLDGDPDNIEGADSSVGVRNDGQNRVFSIGLSGFDSNPHTFTRYGFTFTGSKTVVPFSLETGFALVSTDGILKGYRDHETPFGEVQRVDYVFDKVSVTPIPLPAGFPLLFGALSVPLLAKLRRKKS